MMADANLNIETIIEHIPEQWRGFLGALSVSRDQLLSGESWLTFNLHSNVSEKLEWEKLMKSLCEEEPFCSKESLIFKPRLTFLPLTVQRGVLTLIHHHREEITISALLNLINSVKIHCSHDAWLRALLAMLNEYCDSSCTEGKFQFSNDNAHQVADICSKLQKQDQFCDNMWIPHLRKGTMNAFDVQGQEDYMELLSQRMRPGERSLIEPSDEKWMLTNSQQTNDTQESQIESSQKSQTLIPAEMQVEVNKLKEMWHSSGTVSEGALQSLLIFNHSTEQQMSHICESLELHLLDDTSLHRVCQDVSKLQPEISFSNCVIFLKSSLLKKVQSLQQNASRILLNTFQSFCKQFPRQTIEGVLVPALASVDVAVPAADLVMKALKELSNNHRQAFLGALVSRLEMLSDPVIQVWQSILDNKTNLDQATLSGFIQCVRKYSIDFSENLKYGKLVLSIINKYKTKLSPGDICAIEEISQDNQTFMKKALISAVKKLKSS